MIAKRAWSTFYRVVGRPARSGLRRLDYPDRAQPVEEIRVKTERLVDVLPSDVRIDFLKIDVEGAEGLVLKGAADLIARYRPVVVFEHDLTMAKHFGDDSAELFALLADCGLKVTLMERWLKNQPPLSKADFQELTASKQEFYFMAYAAGD